MKFSSRRKKVNEPKEPNFLIALQLEIQLDPVIEDGHAAEVVMDDMTERLHKWLDRAGFGSHRFRATIFQHDHRPATDPAAVLGKLLEAIEKAERLDPASITLADPNRILH